MVASGIGPKMDLLAPDTWDELACEHPESDKEATQNLITHELIHVYHGKYNPSPDFSDVKGMDWFVEGLATYASGQCNKERIKPVKESIQAGESPTELANFWKGQNRYGNSGTMVMYIDQKYGRQMLMDLLSENRGKSLMEKLKVSEEELITAWKDFVLRL